MQSQPADLPEPLSVPVVTPPDALPAGVEGSASRPDAAPPCVPGTPFAPDGVGPFDELATDGHSEVPRGRTWVRRAALILLGCVTLLGQGEQCRVDRRFVSPSATLVTFWEGMRAGDAESVWECFVEGRNDLPLPGMLWFLPPTERLSLAEFRSLPISAGRVLVRYEVRYVPRGLDQERSFTTGDELVRLRGQWRIARPIGNVSVPMGDPPPRTVDS